MTLSTARDLLKSRFLPGVVLVLGLAVTAAAVVGARTLVDTEANAEVARQADALEDEVARRIKLAEYGLAGARAAFAVAGRLDDADLRAYVAARDLPREFPGIRGFGFIERVQRSDLQAFIRREREAGRPQFDVRTSGTSADLLVIRSLWPLEPNRVAIGYDVGSDPQRRAAAAQAIDSGHATLTEPIRLLQDNRQGRGWLLFLPIYRGTPDTPAARRAALAGLVYVPVIAEDALATVVDAAGTLLGFRLFDGDEAEGRLVYDSRPAWAQERLPVHVHDRKMLVADRVLTLHIETRASAAEVSGRLMPWAVGIGGATLSIALAALTWLLAAGRRAALVKAAAAAADRNRLAVIVERAAGAVFTTDLRGTITWTNPGFEALTGHARSALVGRPVAEVLAPTGQLTPEARLAVRRDLRRGVPHSLEIGGRRPDGTPYWAKIAVQPEREADGRLSGYIGMALDITRRKDVEVRLTARERLLRIITDNMPARVSYWDAQGRCLFVNKRFCEVYDTTSEAVLAQGWRAVPRHLRPGHRNERVREVLQGMPQQFEQTLREPGGRESTWQVHYIPDAEGEEVRGFIVLANEVTELRKARDDALRASQAKTRFLSNMSHEIRTPMNAVLGMLTLLRASRLTERQEDYAAKAEGAGRALLSLLNDVLDFSKIEAGKMQLDCQAFSLETAFAELSVILSANVGAKDIEVLYDLDPRVPDAVVGDDMRLRQILINLGGNAVKFTSQGEVVLRTRLLALGEDRATIAFSVQDSGIGMTPAQQQRLFADYAQATDQTARQYGGTGLGLGICRRLVEMMGSRIELQSEAGSGSLFSFVLTLPLAAHAPALPAPMPAGPRRVLVVDDNAAARTSLGALAGSLGWQVDTCGGGEAAIEAVACAAGADHPYDAVFMDWRMPGLDGWEASLRIRALPAAVRTPLLVMVTAHGREMLAQRPASEQSLLDGFLVKPVTAAMLRQAVERAHGQPQDVPMPPAAQARPLAGLRLLLAEDNAVNQQIACELLAAQGAAIEVVGDGLQAVDRIAAGERYDAVLMDMGMPVLDGLGATLRIRQDLRQTTLPIIAMTANAMDSDRAECLAAGMNDHVGKPVVLAEVVAALLRHLPGRGIPRPAAPVASPPAAAPAAANGPELLLDRDDAVRRLGDAELYAQLMPLFRSNLQQTGRDLDAALVHASREEMVRLLHTIKGMAGNMGATRLARAAQRAEHQVRAGDDQAGPAVHQVADALAATLAEIG